MAERKAMTWEEWSVLDSKERIAIRNPLLERYNSDMKSKHCAALTGEEHKILMIPAPADEQAIIEAVAADLRRLWKEDVDKAVEEAVNGDVPTR